MIVKSKCCLCISVFLVFVLGNIERAGAAPMFDASELYEKLQPSLCAVLALDETGTEIGYGSGFVITKSGDVVTNAHVIAGAVSIKLECNSRIGKALNIARFSPGLDLVVLSSNLSKSSPLNIVSHLDLKPGSLVFALGNPLGFRSTITTGLVSGVRSIDGVDYIQLSADINPGNSGGPIVTQNGEVIGVATMRLEKTQRLSFALPADHIHNLGEVNYSFSEKAIMSDVKVRNNELFISELLFRGLSLGSECEEILSLEGVHLPPSSEEALKLLLGSQLGFSDEGVWNNISLTGSNSGVTQLLGKKVGVNFECRFGKLVSATYMIRENIVNNVNLSLQRKIIAGLTVKYGEPITKTLGDSIFSKNEQLILWTLKAGQEVRLEKSSSGGEKNLSMRLQYIDHELVRALELKEALRAIEFNEL